VSASLDLVEHYAMTYPDDVARHVEGLDPGHAVVVLSALPHPVVAALLPHLAPGHAARTVADLPADVAAAVTGLMRVDGAAALMRRMDSAAVSRIMAALPAGQARNLNALLAYDPGTAGSIMDPDVLVVPVAATVADARALLEANPEHLYYYVYVVDAEHRLAGVFDLAELMQADPGEPVRAIVKPSVTWLSADAPLESVFAHPGWRAFDAMPVVDKDHHFLGMLRHRHMRQLREQETTANGDDRTMRTVLALGEIYWLGLCGLLQGIASTATGPAASGEPS
jgi:magnesium transporter